MSLFDVIKYGGTDLGNFDELIRLPNEILIPYWRRALGSDRTEIATDYVCRRLSYWYNTRSNPNEFRIIFNNVLMEHNNELV